MKTSTFLLVAAAALAAASFVTPSAAQSPASKSTAPAAKATPAHARAPAPDTLARIKSTGQINVAVSRDSLPYSAINDKGELGGYSVDLCKRVIAHLAAVAGVPDLKARWTLGSAAERVAMVASGKADLDCANTTATLSRMQEVDFSSLVFIESGGIMVKDGGPIQKFADLAGRNVGVIGGTTTEARLEAVLKEKLVNAKVTRVKDGNEGIALLASGTLDAFASDKLKLVGLAVQTKDPKAFTMLPEDISLEPLAFALPRGDAAFRLEVNRALTRIYTGGEIDAIFGQWMAPLGRPSALLSAMYLLNAIPK